MRQDKFMGGPWEGQLERAIIHGKTLNSKGSLHDEEFLKERAFNLEMRRIEVAKRVEKSTTRARELESELTRLNWEITQDDHKLETDILPALSFLSDCLRYKRVRMKLQDYHLRFVVTKVLSRYAVVKIAGTCISQRYLHSGLPGDLDPKYGHLFGEVMEEDVHLLSPQNGIA